ncbi:MAG: adenylate kinase [Candidatus Microthrix parvicella]|nr:adenylate kinase [Candidatus Microthrix parvicella]
MRLVIFGRQGAGKGTQSKLLALHLDVPHISTGDIFRAAISAGSEIGLAAKAIMDRGDLIPDDVLRGIVAERLAQHDAANGWLLDGFPRTPKQATDLDEIADPPLDLAINLEVPEDVVVQRIGSRRGCEASGHIYTVGDPAADSARCEIDGSPVVQRDDDTEEAVRHRLALYAQQTEPLLGRYDRAGMLVTVDGVGDVDEVAQRVASAVEGRKAT